MKISELLAGGSSSFSFEFFPPKNEDGWKALFATLEHLRVLKPTFVSVTYGAGGSTRTRTIDLAKQIKRELGMEVLAHITCVGSTRDDLRRIFDQLAEAGIENVLALRGDAPRGSSSFEIPKDGFAYANELIAFLSAEYDFCIGAAAYPETHIEAPDAATDLANLARKVTAGASFLITQVLFENEAYAAFVRRARAVGIGVPIIPGIMPITNFEQVSRFTAMCGASIPRGLLAELEARAGDTAAVLDLGVAFAALQCAELLERGAPGLHFYTLNRSPATRAVVSALRVTG
ncbi:MAG TPA: methylenetetrahydrofolate reductase [NAD(P)H] [Candidatus Baltobacteraceae bacterium]|jgi:methylenetetrahydrofolate reductase (NADPH)|nr:methylenetetrahydrofolate reductase [NAD(P)H] [Candidatus Baltobacteraceae bacterium]